MKHTATFSLVDDGPLFNSYASAHITTNNTLYYVPISMAKTLYAYHLPSRQCHSRLLLNLPFQHFCLVQHDHTLYIHGGDASSAAKLLFEFNINDASICKYALNKKITQHSMISRSSAKKQELIVFGGLRANQQSNVMESFCVQSKQWTEIAVQQAPPPCKDFAYTYHVHRDSLFVWSLPCIIFEYQFVKNRWQCHSFKQVMSSDTRKNLTVLSCNELLCITGDLQIWIFTIDTREWKQVSCSGNFKMNNKRNERLAIAQRDRHSWLLMSDTNELLQLTVHVPRVASYFVKWCKRKAFIDIVIRTQG